jgi:hypothetical protein
MSESIRTANTNRPTVPAPDDEDVDDYGSIVPCGFKYSRKSCPSATAVALNLGLRG